MSGKSSVTFSGDINQNILKNTAIPADLILSKKVTVKLFEFEFL